MDVVQCLLSFDDNKVCKNTWIYVNMCSSIQDHVIKFIVLKSSFDSETSWFWTLESASEASEKLKTRNESIWR